MRQSNFEAKTCNLCQVRKNKKNMKPEKSAKRREACSKRGKIETGAKGGQT